VEAALTELKSRLATLTDLVQAAAVLEWDMTVWMPPGGAPARAAQLATLEEVAHAHQTSDRLGELLDVLAPYEASLPPGSDDASLIRVARRDREKAIRVPTELVAESAEVAAQAYDAWVKAPSATSPPSGRGSSVFSTSASATSSASRRTTTRTTSSSTTSSPG
jgi:carboxypeptidase Taq